MEDIHVTEWGDAGEPVVLVHGSTTWGADPELGFGAQRALSDAFRVIAVDRRGYGRSPDIEHSDYRVDADDVVALLSRLGGAHLVGHSYGGVVAMLAAGLRPDAVRSLTLIEPGCYQVAADDPTVAAAIAANREGLAQIPDDLAADVYLRASCESVGIEPLAPTPERLRAAATSLREIPCWETAIPIGPLTDADWPKLVITGTWETAPDLYRQHGGEPIMTCAAVTADRIGARLLRVPGTAHYSHVDRPDVVNAALRETFG